MKATDFKNGSVKNVIIGSHVIEILRVNTKSCKGWHVSIYNRNSLIYTLNQYHKFFTEAKKHYLSLISNFPNKL